MADKTFLGTALALIQAPMAGVQDARLALAVSQAGALGSLPAAMLGLDALERELRALQAAGQPYNVNFFAHTPPAPDPARLARWQGTLKPYYEELGLEPAQAPAGPNRRPFGAQEAEVLERFCPPVVSFHFGLPTPELLARVKRLGARVLVHGHHRGGGAVAAGARGQCGDRPGPGGRRAPGPLSEHRHQRPDGHAHLGEPLRQRPGHSRDRRRRNW